MTASRSSLAELASRLPGRVALGIDANEPEDAGALLATGWGELDEPLGGVPRGRLSELLGQASSGKLSLLLSMLRHVLAPAEGEPGLAALVDLSGSVFPRGAWAEGRLLVVRPRELPEALRALDVLAASASFDLVALEASGKLPARGLPEALSVRLARLARETGTTISACADRPVFGCLASLRLQLSGTTDGRLHAAVRKNRRGALAETTLERPGLPYPIAAALRRRRDAEVLTFAARTEKVS
jgi:hypothetical protein